MRRILAMRTLFKAGVFAGMTLSLFPSPQGLADSIVAGGAQYTDVIVRESATRYFIATPEDGKAFSVPKSEIDASTVTLSNLDERSALQTAWQRKAGVTVASIPNRPVVSRAEAANQPPPTAMRSSGSRNSPPVINNDYVTDGMVKHIKLDNVPLRDALDATLRPLNLQYQVNDGYLFITSPDRARNEAPGNAATGIYNLRNTTAYTLPKIIVQNPAGPTGRAPGLGGGGGAFGGGGLGGGGMIGGGGMGVGSFGGGGGLGGGGGIAGGGGGGQGLGGGGGGGPIFISNISRLFGTIDDRLVGETPAIIGMSVSGGPTPNRTTRNPGN